jgi:hypothetical protein
LLVNELKLSLPLDSLELELKDSEEEEDTWYNMPFNSNDLNNDSLEPCLTLLTSLAFTLPKITRKEHSIKARIKAIYMLE